MKTLEQLRQYQYFWERMEAVYGDTELSRIPRYNRFWQYCQNRAQAAYERAKAAEREGSTANGH